jgi:hypothetical protein
VEHVLKNVSFDNYRFSDTIVVQDHINKIFEKIISISSDDTFFLLLLKSRRNIPKRQVLGRLAGSINGL